MSSRPVSPDLQPCGRRRDGFAWRASALLLIGFGALLLAEVRGPLRPNGQSKIRRDGRNLCFAALSGLTIGLLQDPLVGPISRQVRARRWGLLKRFELPAWLDTVLALLLMDYTLYLWHLLTHRIAFLWRFHQPHHTDLEMDASTALRFHFGEMALSVPYRAAQVALIGVEPAALALWQRLVLASIFFHHSNLRLPLSMERLLAKVLVTPRLHEIHHSVLTAERNSNWSSGLTLWDRLHGTFRTVQATRTATLGVPEFRSPDQVGLDAMLIAPFKALLGARRNLTQ